MSSDFAVVPSDDEAAAPQANSKDAMAVEKLFCDLCGTSSEVPRVTHSSQSLEPPHRCLLEPCGHSRNLGLVYEQQEKLSKADRRAYISHLVNDNFLKPCDWPASMQEKLLVTEVRDLMQDCADHA